MKRYIWFAAMLLGAIGAAACSGAQAEREAEAPATTAAAQGEVCATASPGPPPTCPDGCVWNGTECRKNRPIVIVDSPSPTATVSSTSTATGVQAPIYQQPSTSP